MNRSLGVIYLAAPLFNRHERATNRRVARVLEEAYEVFLPQRDGVLIPGASLSNAAFALYSRLAFDADVGALQRADAVLAILDGRTIDEGVAFELGYATAIGKPCYAYKSDARVLLPQGDNPMIAGAIRQSFASLKQLRAAVAIRALGTHDYKKAPASAP